MGGSRCIRHEHRRPRRTAPLPRIPQTVPPRRIRQQRDHHRRICQETSGSSHPKTSGTCSRRRIRRATHGRIHRKIKRRHIRPALKEPRRIQTKGRPWRIPPATSHPRRIPPATSHPRRIPPATSRLRRIPLATSHPRRIHPATGHLRRIHPGGGATPAQSSADEPAKKKKVLKTAEMQEKRVSVPFMHTGTQDTLTLHASIRP